MGSMTPARGWRALLRSHRRFDGSDFYAWAGPRSVLDIGSQRLVGPAFYHRFDSFRTVHLAAYDAVRDVLPSGDLHPVRWFDGRAAVFVTAMRYHEVSVGRADGTPDLLAPYGEVLIGALVTRKPSPRGLPLLMPATYRVGGFILDLPVTTAEATELGRKLFGLPKFVADMDFREEPALRQVKVCEDDIEILTLTVRPGGPVTADNAPIIMYSVLHGDLLETSLRFLGHRQAALGRHAGELSLGPHPVAERLRGLSVSAEPLAMHNYLDARAILPVGTPIGTARDYPGYFGSDRLRGRLSVQYPGTDPIDQYTIPEGVLHRAPTEPVV